MLHGEEKPRREYRTFETSCEGMRLPWMDVRDGFQEVARLTSTALQTSLSDLHRAKPSKVALAISSMYFSRLSAEMSLRSWSRLSDAMESFMRLIRAVCRFKDESSCPRDSGAYKHPPTRKVTHTLARPRIELSHGEPTSVPARLFVFHLLARRRAFDHAGRSRDYHACHQATAARTTRRRRDGDESAWRAPNAVRSRRRGPTALPHPV